MPTLIITKIAGEPLDSNEARARALIAYCSQPNPENDPGREKCILFQTFGYSADEGGQMSTEEIADELAHTTTLTPHQGKELVAHWVISWADGTPTAGEALDAARMLLADLGYSETENKITVAIHADTDHVHAHITACRVNTLTGRILSEGRGWWKRESQKSLARIAHKHGWNLAPGALYRVDPKGGEEEYKTPDGKTAKRPRVVTMKDTGKEARKEEKKTELKPKRIREKGSASEQRVLQMSLEKFFAVHGDQMHTWKAADLHRALARIGISCERVTHGKGRHGLVFSIGKNRYAARDLFDGLTYRSLLARIDGGWRDARPEIAAILADARANITARRELVKHQDSMAQRKEREQRAAMPKAQAKTQTPHKAASRPRPYQPPKGGQVNAKDDPATALLNSIFGAGAPKTAAPEPMKRKENEQPPAQAAQEVGENGLVWAEQRRTAGGTADHDPQDRGRDHNHPQAQGSDRRSGGRPMGGNEPRRPGAQDRKRDQGSGRELAQGDGRQAGQADAGMDRRPVDHAAHEGNGNHARGLPGRDGQAGLRNPAAAQRAFGERGGQETEPRDRRAAGTSGSPGIIHRDQPADPADAALLDRFRAAVRKLQQAEIQQDIDTRHGPRPGYGRNSRPLPTPGPRGPRQ